MQNINIKHYILTASRDKFFEKKFKRDSRVEIALQFLTRRRRWDLNPQAAVKRHSLANCSRNRLGTPPVNYFTILIAFSQLILYFNLKIQIIDKLEQIML